jgi:protein tyrosine/serine phosphatase
MRQKQLQAQTMSAPVMAGRRAWVSMMLADHGIFRALFNNFHEVGNGVYRSNQPGPRQLRNYRERYGIRTVINLRGLHPFGSYELEREACARLGIEFHDMRLYSRIPPSPGRVAKLVDLFGRIEYPVLMHCKSGADRVGLAAALYRITQLNHPVSVAKAELALRYGHVRHSRTGVLDYFLDDYLQQAGNNQLAFMDWVRNAYDDETLKQRFRARGWANIIVDDILHRE